MLATQSRHSRKHVGAHVCDYPFPEIGTTPIARRFIMRLPNLPLQLLISDFTDTSGLETWFSSFKGQTDYEVRDLSITTGDIVAFSHCLCRIIGTKSDGERVNMWTRQTICFRKIDGPWLIVHSHLSVPFYMTANHKTAVDLTPD